MATRLETSIGKRRHKRIKMVLPVKVSGAATPPIIYGFPPEP
jgi:hypothetical protein